MHIHYRVLFTFLERTEEFVKQNRKILPLKVIPRKKNVPASGMREKGRLFKQICAMLLKWRIE